VCAGLGWLEWEERRGVQVSEKIFRAFKAQLS
jgi:hypothetical protein